MGRKRPLFVSRVDIPLFDGDLNRSMQHIG
jgi:hypothetical protein